MVAYLSENKSNVSKAQRNQYKASYRESCNNHEILYLREVHRRLNRLIRIAIEPISDIPWVGIKALDNHIFL